MVQCQTCKCQVHLLQQSLSGCELRQILSRVSPVSSLGLTLLQMCPSCSVSTICRARFADNAQRSGTDPGRPEGPDSPKRTQKGRALQAPVVFLLTGKCFVSSPWFCPSLVRSWSALRDTDRQTDRQTDSRCESRKNLRSWTRTRTNSSWPRAKSPNSSPH